MRTPIQNLNAIEMTVCEDYVFFCLFLVREVILSFDK